MEDLRGSLDQDASVIRPKIDALTQAAMKIGEAMYKASQAAADDGPDAGGGSDGGADASGGANRADGDGVVDADFEEVDDDRKSQSA